MAIDTSSTISVSNSSSVNQTASSSTMQKSSADSSFKDEMNKVSNTENKDSKKETDTKKAEESKSSELKTENSDRNINKQDKKNATDQNNAQLNGEISINDQLNLSFNDVNNMLVNDIQAMAESNSLSRLSNWAFSFGNGKTSTIKMNESDAQFFINLTKNNDISMQNITIQAQNMNTSDINSAEINQNVKVSQTLLNALSEARENNQPIRIDFDQNVSVILRVNQNGAISAQFIPGDKAVEQYLRQNIDILKNTFDENNLPYSDLSYSHSSKDQNKKRREQEQQGE